MELNEYDFEQIEIAIHFLEEIGNLYQTKELRRIVRKLKRVE